MSARTVAALALSLSPLAACSGEFGAGFADRQGSGSFGSDTAGETDAPGLEGEVSGVGDGSGEGGDEDHTGTTGPSAEAGGSGSSGASSESAGLEEEDAGDGPSSGSMDATSAEDSTGPGSTGSSSSDASASSSDADQTDSENSSDDSLDNSTGDSATEGSESAGTSEEGSAEAEASGETGEGNDNDADEEEEDDEGDEGDEGDGDWQLIVEPGDDTDLLGKSGSLARSFCPEDHLLVGLEGFTGFHELLGLRGRCAALKWKAGEARLTAEGERTSEFIGDDEGTTWQRKCPPHTFVSAFKLRADDRGINPIKFACSPLHVKDELEIVAGEREWLDHVGDSSSFLEGDDCGAYGAARGLQIMTNDDNTAAFGLLCGEVYFEEDR